MAMPFQKQLLTIEEFERAWEEGAFPPDARLELIRGEVVEMSPSETVTPCALCGSAISCRSSDPRES